LVLAAGARVLVPASPCPQLFYYYEDGRTSQILGALHVPPPPSDAAKITIHVDFIVPVYLKSVSQ
jgi:hypothetical protein